jgi:hypothetical protein
MDRRIRAVLVARLGMLSYNFDFAPLSLLPSSLCRLLGFEETELLNATETL